MESSDHHFIRSRVSNACDSCKARKVKCDGKLPCSYCTRRHRADTCHYSPQLKRRHARRSDSQQLPRSPRNPAQEPGSERTSRQQHSPPRRGSRPQSQTPRDTNSSSRDWSDGPAAQQQQQQQHHAASTTHDTDGDEEAEVPREARLLCDAQGKLIFIGDCAPLSFFQSVRQLITSRVDENALSPNSSRYSVLENAPSKQHFFSGGGSSSRGGAPDPLIDAIPAAVSRYFAATAGLVDLFENTDLTQAITSWAKHGSGSSSNTSVVHYLVLAIGHQDTDESPSQDYFEYARSLAFQNLSENLGIGTVQAYVLITLFMLRACQINGAFLFFGIAVRSAYSIGIHRTEVNQRFGPQMQRQRDRLWISLRVVDLFLSTNMGRPPATSDIDCTVPYRTVDGATGQETFDTLSASAQIFLIMEALVVEVYSRRKISLQLTEGISSQLRDWSGRWLPQIKELMTSAEGTGTGGSGSSATTPTPGGHGLGHKHDSQQIQQVQVCAATQVLSSYYYAVILVSRPFLMFEVHRRLGGGPSSRSSSQQTFSGKSKLADACIDAACLMVELVSDVIERGFMPVKMPLVVSWLFAASLTLGLGLVGNFGRILERYSRTSILALEFFARTDAHAMQYSLIAKSLLDAALAFLEKRDMAERLQRTQSSAQLFGLMPSDKAATAGQSPTSGGSGTFSPTGLQHRGSADSGSGMSMASGGAGGTGGKYQASQALPNGTPGALRLLSMNSPFGGGGGLGLNGTNGNNNNSSSSSLNDTSSLLGGIDAEAGFLSLSGLVSGTTPGGPTSGSNDADAMSFDPLMIGGGEAGDQSFNLFPLLEASGDIDLAHYF
ncbi:uncharacterized protein B0I36DRAFT_357334 [Microdochium trichocladiopsis]|uniref:Zn(2)-C6 fungal-type domain-containing protein n=1 Tax=Microdochium trichocladiopsis TaxID=1682393 RepID=A0A9P8YH91_9PEZI|nr:uncharacterized protein B0I36DRAFT_357334 [Microdochium trichocladiopsis]KAH7039967.1 hypothetical protein B0I36DRAFT_357334 [Microdochium trichocladiopsis]